MKSMFLTTIACLFVLIVSAKKSSDGVEEKISKVNFLYPSFEKEFKLSKTTTWGYRVGLNTFFEIGSSYNFYSGTSTTRYFELAPTADINCRWYYRILKRQEKGKKTINNSSGYFLTGARILTPGIKFVTQNNSGLNDVISGVYVGWGFRRTLGEKLTIDFNINNEVLMRNLEEIDFLNIHPGFILGYRISR